MKIQIIRDLPKRLTGSLRLARIKANIFEAAIAVFAVLTSLGFLLDPNGLQRTAIGETLPGVAFVWMVIYGLSGLMAIIGLLRYRFDIEIAGLFLLSGGVLINLVSVISVFGLFDRLPSIGIYIATVVACLVRINTIRHGEDTFLLKADEEKDVVVVKDDVVDVLKDEVLKKAVVTEDILKGDIVKDGDH